MMKTGLGRGLGALLGTPPVGVSAPAMKAASAVIVQPTGVPLKVPIDRLKPCANQPRKSFPTESLRELADSIKEQGILQPLVAHRRGEHFEIIAGERRWRAAKLAGLAEVPVVLREADDRAFLELALIENLQREDLNPMEEAEGYALLIQKYSLTQEAVAQRLGRNRVSVANALRLQKLCSDVKGYLRTGRISVGHAKVLLGLPGEAEQKVAAEKVIRDSLSVRETEQLVTEWQGRRGTIPTRKAEAPQDRHVAQIESKLKQRLGTQVRLRYRNGKGSLDIRFFNDDDLERILEVMGVETQ
ncbi:MAG: ParB/RepB/Spo0J family partition protein [Pedosphaera sp.]|nr:ParB/RepB/Spo0J family partition protein [Pedosphaera sp.]